MSDKIETCYKWVWRIGNGNRVSAGEMNKSMRLVYRTDKVTVSQYAGGRLFVFRNKEQAERTRIFNSGFHQYGKQPVPELWEVLATNVNNSIQLTPRVWSYSWRTYEGFDFDLKNFWNNPLKYSGDKGGIADYAYTADSVQLIRKIM
jgi:hypothetical protein